MLALEQQQDCTRRNHEEHRPIDFGNHLDLSQQHIIQNGMILKEIVLSIYRMSL